MSWFEIWYMLKSVCLAMILAAVIVGWVARMFRHDDDEDDES